MLQMKKPETMTRHHHRTNPEQPQVQVITITQPTGQRQNECCGCDQTYPRYKSKSSNILGWLQIALALLFIVLQIAGLAIQNDRYYTNYTYYVGAAFWCAPFVSILTGIL